MQADTQKLHGVEDDTGHVVLNGFEWLFIEIISLFMHDDNDEYYLNALYFKSIVVMLSEAEIICIENHLN